MRFGKAPLTTKQSTIPHMKNTDDPIRGAKQYDVTALPNRPFWNSL